MLFEEREINLVKWIGRISDKRILLLPESPDVENIVDSLRNPERTINWIDSSGKSDLPPDFYNDTEMLMMDVMRVDDHGYRKKGNTINPNLSRRHEIERELKEAFGDFICGKNLFINSVTDLPGEQDHNYKFYLDNFKRTINNHKNKISNYKNNHPMHKIIFFVFDESSAYFEKEEDIVKGPQNDAYGRPHFWFLDSEFLDIFLNTEIDYLIWVSPYKRFKEIYPPVSIPQACIFKCLNFPHKDSIKKYKPECMVSVEI